MDNKELTVKGFFRGCDQEKLFDYLANEERITLVASEDCPTFLEEAVSRMAREKRVKSSTLWQELIQDGARELLTKWKSKPDTNVSEALDRLHKAGQGMYSNLYNMVRSFDSHSNGVYTGKQAVVIIHDSLFLDGWDDEDEAYLDTCCSEWGLDFGDFCFLSAAVAAKKLGLTVMCQGELERTENYLREKVWFINALVSQAQNPLPRSVLEEATDLLYSKGVSDNG